VLSAGSDGGRSGGGGGGRKLPYEQKVTGRGRMAAYEDLVAGVMSCGDYSRKSAAVEWALRLRSRI
jgi:hypothetical protein